MSAPKPAITSLALPQLQEFSIALPWVTGTDDLRFDASFYNPRVAEALALLQRSGLTIKPLQEVTSDIFIPPRFKRIYVGRDHGVPFLQGGHVVHFDPADIKYLSRTAHKKLDQWIIRKDWVLVTCSGTIGRVTISLPSWDGWAASQHILRIIPGKLPSGYIYAFLSSELGQAQLTSQVYGAVVDEITEYQCRSVQIPVPTTDEQWRQANEINRLATEAMLEKDRAIKKANQAVDQIQTFIPELRAKLDSQTEAAFKQLAQVWRVETGMLSVIQQKTSHPAYQSIIRMGTRVLPFIFKELQAKCEHWLGALREITGENPAKRDDTFEQANATWLQWAKQRNYI